MKTSAPGLGLLPVDGHAGRLDDPRAAERVTSGPDAVAGDDGDPVGLGGGHAGRALLGMPAWGAAWAAARCLGDSAPSVSGEDALGASSVSGDPGEREDVPAAGRCAFHVARGPQDGVGSGIGTVQSIGEPDEGPLRFVGVQDGPSGDGAILGEDEQDEAVVGSRRTSPVPPGEAESLGHVVVARVGTERVHAIPLEGRHSAHVDRPAVTRVHRRGVDPRRDLAVLVRGSLPRTAEPANR